jgi:hypothetical protein
MTINVDSNAVSSTQLREFLCENLRMPPENYITPMIQGIPGIGKTEIVVSSCRDVSLPCKVIRPIQHESVEFTGVPTVWTDETGTRAAWAALDDLLPREDGWVIFLDEITQLPVNEQKVIAGLLDKEGVAGRRIGPNTKFICAGNRTQDRAGANRLISIIESRTWQVELVFSVDGWIEWAVEKGIEPFIQEFARMKGSEFVQFDASRTINALPRTWERVDRAVKHAPAAADCMTRGLVGNGMAAELKAFRQHFEILKGALVRILESGSPEKPGDITQHDTKDPVQAMSVQHALLGACTHYARENPGMSDKYLTNLMRYASEHLDKSLAGLFMHRLAFDCVKSSASEAQRAFAFRVNAHPVWQQFLKKNTDVLKNWKGGK